MKFEWTVINKVTRFSPMCGTISGHSDVQKFVQILKDAYPSDTYNIDFFLVEEKVEARKIDWEEIQVLQEDYDRELSC